MWQKRLLVDTAAVAWRNGHGLTRIIAEDRAHTPPEWRLSVADILHDAPFSTFAGWKRLIALIGPGTLVLHEKAGAWFHTLETCCKPYTFCGEDQVLSSCTNGAVQALNLMIRCPESVEKNIEFALHQTSFSIQSNEQEKRDYFLFPSTGGWTMQFKGTCSFVSRGSVWYCSSENMPDTTFIPKETGSSLYCIRI
ncbi:hypothetical protein B9K05_09205 [Acetobacter syzygii]|uniref:HutD-family protein n=1 Tax=Acetobacter syzygii TaxID=146476 RepID=A0A270BG28_9PROT|nr:hypothetical protein B9K05_09205 [Acetobacter syzygii]PAL24673.1 hypothetical protein B9K04_08695 [Acetobacter syzygii]